MVSLDTGATEAFAAACHLYESAGFSRCGPFDTYVEADFSRNYSLGL